MHREVIEDSVDSEGEENAENAEKAAELEEDEFWSRLGT